MMMFTISGIWRWIQLQSDNGANIVGLLFQLRLNELTGRLNTVSGAIMSICYVPQSDESEWDD